MPECPTPTKRRYATRKAAELAAARTVHVYGRLLNPYTCRGCGWIHLSKYAPAENYTPTTTETPRSAA